jgi:hypothetical protein
MEVLLKMEKAIIIKPRPAVGGEIVATPPAHVEAEIAATRSLLDEVSMLFGAEGYLTIDELAEKYPEVHAAIGNIVGRIEGLPKLVLHAVAPPEGKEWKDIVEAVKQGQSFSLKVWVVGFPQPLEKARRQAVLSYSIPVMVGEVVFEPSERTVKVGDIEVHQYNGVFDPLKAYTRDVKYIELPEIREGRKKDILTEEEIEGLKEEFLEEGEEKEEISLEELKEKEERVWREEEEKEKEELVEQLISRIGEDKKLLKQVLLSKIAALFEKIKTPILQKAKKDSDKRDDVEGAKRKLEEGLKALSAGDGLEALEDFAIARFYLFDHDSYTEPLVNAFDDLMDMAWNVYKGRKYSKERAREIVQRILRLIESPRGKRAEPPRRVDSPRDARLWEMAKRIVKEEYKDVEEDSEQFWRLVSRIFTRMKLRLGGAREEAVEKIVEELQEEHGKLPSVGKGAKTAKEVERLKEKHLRSKEG